LRNKVKMPREVNRWINEHEFPGVYYHWPGILALQWLTNRVLYHRSWLIRKEVEGSIRCFKPGVNFLDAGCGAGDFLVPCAANHKDGSFTGMDKSGSNIDMIRFFSDTRNIRNLKLIHQDLDSPLEDGPWQVILCASVLHYLDDPGRFIHMAAAKLVPGGHLLLYVPLNYKRRIPGYQLIRNRLLKGVDYDHGR